MKTPTTVTQVGATYNITDGTINGINLFHSFGLFSVGMGDTAAFNGPGGIAIYDWKSDRRGAINH